MREEGGKRREREREETGRKGWRERGRRDEGGGGGRTDCSVSSSLEKFFVSAVPGQSHQEQ